MQRPSHNRGNSVSEQATALFLRQFELCREEMASWPASKREAACYGVASLPTNAASTSREDAPSVSEVVSRAANAEK